MNQEINFSYQKVKVPGWVGNTCIVSVGEVRFMSLGFPKGQTYLNPDQVQWFEKNGDEVVRVCKLVNNFENGSIQQSAAIRMKHDLLDKFCEECKIKDS
jgi:hypothetical protein